MPRCAPFVLAAALSACGGTVADPDAVPWTYTALDSCTITTTSGQVLCAEYDTLPDGGLTTTDASCMLSGGTPGTGCTRVGALGWCAFIDAAGGHENKVYYPGGGVTASTAQASCAGKGGLWTPG